MLVNPMNQIRCARQNSPRFFNEILLLCVSFRILCYFCSFKFITELQRITSSIGLRRKLPQWKEVKSSFRLRTITGQNVECQLHNKACKWRSWFWYTGYGPTRYLNIKLTTIKDSSFARSWHISQVSDDVCKSAFLFQSLLLIQQFNSVAVHRTFTHSLW